jgi:hypothetical protein
VAVSLSLPPTTPSVGKGIFVLLMMMCDEDQWICVWNGVVDNVLMSLVGCVDESMVIMKNRIAMMLRWHLYTTSTSALILTE